MTYFKASKSDKLICTLCQHYCHIKAGKTGICGVNKNVGDHIECLVYGHPSALNVDPIEKKPLYHFLPGSKILSLGTVGCNFHCDFCQNWGISQEHNIDTSNYFSPQRLVELALEHGVPSIAYTYNEPTIFYPYARDIALEGKKHGLKNVYVSNGFESDKVIDDMDGIIDGINIDLKAYNAHYYKKNLGGNLQKVLDNIEHFASKTFGWRSRP
jgi:pyruvate formate lyase activating enzyme